MLSISYADEDDKFPKTILACLVSGSSQLSKDSKQNDTNAPLIISRSTICHKTSRNLKWEKCRKMRQLSKMGQKKPQLSLRHFNREVSVDFHRKYQSSVDRAKLSMALSLR